MHVLGDAILNAIHQIVTVNNSGILDASFQNCIQQYANRSI